MLGRHSRRCWTAPALLHRPLVPVLVPPMLASRVVLGVHYPADVLAGSALGALLGAGRVSAAGERSLMSTTAVPLTEVRLASSPVAGLDRAMRPRQWVKNVLALGAGDRVLQVLSGLLVLTLVAAMYL